ncbi:MAG: FecR domain-containing protein [Spirochaetes bacterium]|nr:FecR domain-containing protein [Spirochaetota bacterium]
MKKNLIFIILLLLLFSGTAFAKIVVQSSKGDAAFKKDRNWVPLKKGMTLSEGTKISTGVRSWAVLDIDGDTVKINQLTMMKVFRNRPTPVEKNTHLALKHGSLKARIQKIGKLKTSFRISTPVATSSVRGTEELVSYGARSGMTIEVLEGIVEGRNIQGSIRRISGKSVFRQGPNDSKPKNLLFSLKDQSLPSLFDPNTTDDEKNAHEYSGFDLVNDSENPADIVENASDFTPESTVNLEVTWEEK